MKIALCLHGLFNSTTDSSSNGDDGFEYIKENILDKGEVDVYIHSWELDKKNSNQFEMVWINLNLKHRHFKKSIEYGFFEAKTETVNGGTKPILQSPLRDEYFIAFVWKQLGGYFELKP